MKKINFNNARFIKSAPSVALRPTPNLSEVVFVGKSNVGKSSLINALTGRKSLAYTSSKPGFTTMLNYYLIDEAFYLVDVPGYGYSSKGSRDLGAFGKMMEEYFKNNEKLKNVCFLVDSRHFPSSDDIDFYMFAKQFNIPITVVLTKTDKLNQSQKATARKNIIEAFNLDPKDAFFVSEKDERALYRLKEHISRVLS